MTLFLNMTEDKVSYINPDGNLVNTTLDDLPDGYDRCYMLGTKDNLTVLPALHDFYTNKKANFKFFMGATQNIDLNGSNVLFQLTNMSPTIALPFHWLEVTQEVLDTVLLINTPEIESYRTNHSLNSYLSFAGIPFSDDVISIVKEIVDPRWFLNGRNNFLNRLDSYFGIKFPVTQKRKVRLELLDRVKESADKDKLNLSKRGHAKILHYIARSWLTKLDIAYKIDPTKFFTNKVTLERFYATFGE